MRCIFLIAIGANIRWKSVDNIPMPASDSLTAADDLPAGGVDFCTGAGDIHSGADDSRLDMMIYSTQPAS